MIVCHQPGEMVGGRERGRLMGAIMAVSAGGFAVGKLSLSFSLSFSFSLLVERMAVKKGC